MTDIETHTPPAPPQPVFGFTARRFAFALILFVNMLLTIVTLGIYRFWGKVRVRRYMWRHVRLMGDPFEYTGTGGELFLGFLVVLAILFPLGLVYSAIDTLIPPARSDLRIAAEIVYYAVLFALLQIGFYRMWRYRLSRTVWRGIRFGLDGSSWTYLKLAVGWTVLCLLTLGVAYPWMQIDLWRYQARHTRLGDRRFVFEGTAKALLLPWLCVNVPLAIFVGVLIVLSSGIVTEDFYKLRQFGRENVVPLAIVGTVLALGFISLPFTWLNYKVREVRLRLSGLNLGPAQCRSQLPYGRLLGFAALCVIVILMILSPVFILVGDAVSGDLLDPTIVGAGLVFVIALVVAVSIFAPAIWAIGFGFEVIRQTVLTTDVSNPHVLEEAAQSALQDPKMGEGLADALDIGAF